MAPGSPPSARLTKSGLGAKRAGGQTAESARSVARPTGVEPVTPTFGGWCSIQLSYGRMVLAIRRAGRGGGRL
jgi:hypothetical protein